MNALSSGCVTASILHAVYSVCNYSRFVIV